MAQVGNSNQEDSSDWESGYYAQLAKAVYQEGEKNKWSQEKIFEMLQNPKEFERHYTWQQQILNETSGEAVLSSTQERLVIDAAKRLETKQRYEEEKERLRIQAEDEELAELVASQTTKTGQKKKGRSTAQFIQDQSRHEQKKMERLMKVIDEEKESQQVTFHPKISKKSHLLMQKKRQQAQEQTQAEDEDEANETLVANKSFRKPAEVQELSFTPKINDYSKNLNRTMKIEDTLTVDAKRLAHKKKKLQASALEEEVNTTQGAYKPTSKDSQNIVFNRFKRDLDQVDAAFESVVSNNNDTNQETATELFIQMGFLRRSSDADLQQMADIWEHLRGEPLPEQEADEEQEGEEDEEKEKPDAPTIKAQRIKVFMCAIQNHQLSWMSQDAEDAQDEDKKDLLGFVTSKDAYGVTPQDIATIHRRFHQLAANRTDFVMQTKNQFYNQKAKQRETVEAEHSFRPTIDKKSEKILKDKKIPKGLSYPDYLFERAKEIEKKKEAARREKADKEYQDEELTFKPKILKKKGSDEKRPADSGNKCEELYQQKSKYQSMKFDRERDAVEYTMSPEEFTFTPVIMGDKRAGKAMPSFSEQKQLDAGHKPWKAEETVREPKVRKPLYEAPKPKEQPKKVVAPVQPKRSPKKAAKAKSPAVPIEEAVVPEPENKVFSIDTNAGKIEEQQPEEPLNIDTTAPVEVAAEEEEAPVEQQQEASAPERKGRRGRKNRNPSQEQLIVPTIAAQEEVFEEEVVAVEEKPKDEPAQLHGNDGPLDNPAESSEDYVDGEDSEEEDEECVYMDIKLGEVKHRITLFEDSDPQQLADEFAKEHNLPEHMKGALFQQLTDNYNANFGEESDEEDEH